MFKMSSQVENVVNAYKTLSKIPIIVGGRLNNKGNTITSKWLVRNLDKGKMTKYIYKYTIDDSLKVIAESDFGMDVSNELLSAVSPKETYKAIIREDKDSKEGKKQFLEIWRANTLAHVIDLTALDLHGDVYADSEFGSLDWNQEETAVVYVAEKKLKKSEPFIKRKSPEDSSKKNGSGEKPTTKGAEYVYKQDWGEQLVGKHLSVIVMCQIDTETCTVLEGLPESCCPGQVRFALDGKSVVGVGWETEPRRLGLIFCTNRPSYIFSLTLDGQMRKLSSEGVSVRSPRLGPRGQLVWLQRAAGGPHHACHAIVLKRNDSDEVRTVIGVVQTEMPTTNTDSIPFYGVYCQALPSKCFSSDGKWLLFSTSQQTTIRSYIVDIDNGTIADITHKGPNNWSTTIVDVKSDIVLATFSNIANPAQLCVGKLPEHNSDMVWHKIGEGNPDLVPGVVSKSSTVCMNITHEDSQDSVKSFTAIYNAPLLDDTNKSKLPLIVWPHGGPHSGFVNSYSLETAFFTMLGFATLQINYRGSTGAGDASVLFLPKRVGDCDVKDCKLATEEALKLYGTQIDEKNICLFGGSHGGFLVTHLSGQYPDLYKVVVSRNPVVDVASMFNSTDIADWCAVETGFDFIESGPVSEEQLLAMRRCSPLVHVHKVKAPTALMLGSGDKRVPYYQGLEYSRRLKANGVDTRIFMYDDNHSLASLPAEMDNLINSALWFLEHLKP